MKLVSIEDAQSNFASVCQQALSGEIIRLQHPRGLLELRSVVAPALTKEQLAECNVDDDWAAFENACGKASI